MSVSNKTEQRGVPPPSTREALAPRVGPPRDTDYGPRLGEAEAILRGAELQPSGTAVVRRRADEHGASGLFPSDPRATLVLLNHARYRAIQGVFGVRRDQVNLMTFIATLTLAEAAYRKTEPLRRGFRPTRADLMLGDGLLNALGQRVVGPSSHPTPFAGALLGAAAVGTVAPRLLHHGSTGVKGVARGIKLSFHQVFGHRGGLMPHHTHSD